MGRDKGVHAFLKGIDPKVSVMVQLEFELTTSQLGLTHLEKGSNIKKKKKKKKKSTQIIIKTCWQHRFPWLSLSICPYHPSLSAGLPNYILCLHRADMNKFLLFARHWHVYV